MGNDVKLQQRKILLNCLESSFYSINIWFSYSREVTVKTCRRLTMLQIWPFLHLLTQMKYKHSLVITLILHAFCVFLLKS